MKTILISGTSQGIGKQLAQMYLQRGDKVYGISRNPCSFDNENYTQLICDLSNSDQLAELCGQLKETSFDLFIHGAMYTPRHRPFLRVGVQDMQLSYQVGVIAPLEIIKSIYSSLKQQQGDVVLLSSAITLTGSKGQIPYLCAKSALNALALGLGQELGNSGVTIKALALGLVDTAKVRANVSQQMLEKLKEQSPGGDFINIQEIFEVINKTRGKNNGETLTVVHGGMP